MQQLLIIGLGGFLGAVARYGLSGLVHHYYRGSFPFGTLVVNVLGCLAIGVLAALVSERQLFSPALRLFLLIGLLGSFTTFSTMGFETFELLRERALLQAFGNLLLNATLGLAAVGVGQGLVQIVF